MPKMPILTDEQRSHMDRWERVSGKALKDWVTAIMKRMGTTRDEARGVVLRIIKEHTNG